MLYLLIFLSKIVCTSENVEKKVSGLDDVSINNLKRELTRVHGDYLKKIITHVYNRLDKQLRNKDEIIEKQDLLIQQIKKNNNKDIQRYEIELEKKNDYIVFLEKERREKSQAYSVIIEEKEKFNKLLKEKLRKHLQDFVRCEEGYADVAEGSRSNKHQNLKVELEKNTAKQAKRGDKCCSELAGQCQENSEGKNESRRSTNDAACKEAPCKSNDCQTIGTSESSSKISMSNQEAGPSSKICIKSDNPKPKKKDDSGFVSAETLKEIFMKFLSENLSGLNESQSRPNFGETNKNLKKLNNDFCGVSYEELKEQSTTKRKCKFSPQCNNLGEN